MVDKRNIPISLPSTGEEEWLAVREPIESGWLTQGPKVAEFEKQFADFHHIKYALATTSCTTALHLALATLDVGPGDEVIVPAFTWISTANVVLYTGATPVFVDVDPATFNIDLGKIQEKITAKTKAIIPVHLFGLCVDIEKLKSALPDQIAIIEDAACASGAEFNNKHVGAHGDFAAFSFHPRKSITTGEGGMLITNNDQYAEKANMLRNHGASISEEQRHKGPKPYILPEFALLGFNYRMTDLQGAIGLVQLSKLEQFITERAKWAAWYREQLQDIDWIRCPQEPESGRHAWQAFVTFINEEVSPKSRNDIMDILQSYGISTRPGTHAVHMLEYYQKKYDLKPSDYPGAQVSDHQSMAIPLHNRMTEDDYQYVVDVISAID